MDKNKQQLIEKIKQSANVLVTVSENPSVDQLAGAVGFTLLLNKLGKHATAVFSGKVPSTIEFLKPEKTLEKNTDSLRDFIIALDKEKADKLRYKVEDSHVRIFITPYKTSISEKDLEFSQGDFNVDMVIALGVHEQSHLDAAIKAHGRILHDATVFAVNNQPGPDIGGVDVLDEKASSLCEILTNIGEALQSNIFDSQMSTALLTGIVAETDRFRNAKTSATTMSASAALMKAGANQQLVASSLEAELVVAKQAASGKGEEPLDLPKVEDPKTEKEPADPSLLKVNNYDDPKPENKPAETAPVKTEDKPKAPLIGLNPPEPAKPDLPKPPTPAVPDQKPKPNQEEIAGRAYLDPADEPKDDGNVVLGQIHIDEHGEIKPDSGDDELPPKKVSEMKEHLTIEPPEHTKPKVTDQMASSLPGSDDLSSAVSSLQESTDSAPDPYRLPDVPNPYQPSSEPTPAPPQPGQDSIDAARAAVNQAADNKASDQPLNPIEALNAQPIDLNMGQDINTLSMPEPPTQPAKPDQYDVLPPSTITPRPDDSQQMPPPPPPVGSAPPPPVPPPMMPPTPYQ